MFPLPGHGSDTNAHRTGMMCGYGSTYLQISHQWPCLTVPSAYVRSAFVKMILTSAVRSLRRRVRACVSSQCQSPCPCKQALTLYHSISHGHSSCLLQVRFDICRIPFVFTSLTDLDFSRLVVAVLTCSSSPTDSTSLCQLGFSDHLLPRASLSTDAGNPGYRRGIGGPFLRGQ